MDNEIVECLIDHVKIHEFLYDVSHKDYKNVSLKLAAWESIGRELNLTGEAVRNKWKTIRDGYTKYKKQAKAATVSNKKTSYYIWSSQLTFLDNYNAPRSNDATETTPTSPSQSIQANMNSELAQYFITPVSPNMLSSTPPPDLAAVPTTSTTRYGQRQNLRRNNLVRPTRNSTSNDDVRKVIHYLKKKEHDGIDHLFLSYAETFKKFPAREQAIMKIELAKLFANTELQLIHSTTNASHHMFVDVNEDLQDEAVNVKEEEDSI